MNMRSRSARWHTMPPMARGSYATKAYHDFIGFQVSKPILERGIWRQTLAALDKVKGMEAAAH